MRSALFFAVLAVLLISTHAWEPPNWKDMRKKAQDQFNNARKQVEDMKKHLSPSLQHMVHLAMKKLDEHHAKKDVHKALEALHRDLMSRWRNQAAVDGLQIKDHEALKALMMHAALAQARHNLEKSTVMQNFAQHLASKFLGENRPADQIKAFGKALSVLGHNYMHKFFTGAETIMHKNGVNLNKEQLYQVLHGASAEAMKGKPVMEALMAEMKKVGVNTDGLDNAVKEQLKQHFEKLKTEGMVELKKVMTAHKISLKISEAVAAMQIKAKEMVEKLKAMRAAAPKTTLYKMQELAKKAFKMNPGDEKKLMMKLHFIIRPALDSHFHVLAGIFKKHDMGADHTVIHYTIYHRMKKELDNDGHHHHHHHHRWWRKLRLAAMIGGPILGVAFLVALIIVIVHMVKEKRRTPRKEICGEKCTLPYSVMDEKNSTKA